MSKESKGSSDNDLLAKLHQARELVDECIVELRENSRLPSKANPAVSKRSRARHHASQPTQQLSFGLNARAFMKKYGRTLAGPQKFALLLARLAGGKVGHEVALADIKRHWNKMKNILEGKFNAAYGTRAKDNGWVDTPEHGVYVLSSGWREALAP